MPTSSSLVELLAAQPDVDSTGWFGKLWDITRELSEKLTARFELKPDGSTEQFANYASLDGNAKGSLNTFTGPEIDWLVHAHLTSAIQNLASPICTSPSGWDRRSRLHILAWRWARCLIFSFILITSRAWI